jgi:hypothetical protein
MAYRFLRPTQKNLREYLRVEGVAKELADLLKAVEPGYRSTSASSGREVEKAMDAADKAMGGTRGGSFGVESIRSSDYSGGYWGDAAALYVNTGDTYNMTLVYDVADGRFYVTSWGDWAEDCERRGIPLA